MAILHRNKFDLHYELTGSGVPILWIQGVGVAGSGWSPQIKALSEFASLSFDNRGIGKSQKGPDKLTIEAMAADVLALMNNVGWDAAHLVGHSMGGLIAQEVALQKPKRVKSLTLMCTFSQGREAARLTPWVVWMGMRTRIGTARMRRRAFLEMIFSAEYLNQRNLDELAIDMIPIIGRDLATQPSVLMDQLRCMSKYDRSSDLATLASIPTLVVSADRDQIAKPVYGERLASLIPGARFQLLPLVSHAAPIECPDEVNRMLRAFFPK